MKRTSARIPFWKLNLSGNQRIRVAAAEGVRINYDDEENDGPGRYVPPCYGNHPPCHIPPLPSCVPL